MTGVQKSVLYDHMQSLHQFHAGVGEDLLNTFLLFHGKNAGRTRLTEIPFTIRLLLAGFHKFSSWTYENLIIKPEQQSLPGETICFGR